MKLKITISMDNDAFSAGENATRRFRNAYEPARILRRLADEIDQGGNLEMGEIARLRDVNGNEVGTAKVTR